MLNNNDSKRCLVIPKWLDFEGVIKAKELNSPRQTPFSINSKTEKYLQSDYQDFKDDPRLEKASDLMGAALVIDQKEIAEEMARYVLKYQRVSSPTRKLAQKVLNLNIDIPLLKTNIKIAQKRTKLTNYPKNPILWVDLARLYVIKGHIDKARKAIIVALSLAPFNRYVVRNAVRFFLHIGELDAAWHYISRATQNNSDPWLKATELSVAILAKKNIKKPSGLIPNDPSPTQVFIFSELISNYGMLEFMAGNSAVAKKNFRLAWSNPSNNVIRHGEWLLRNKLPGLTTTTNLDFKKSAEALTWHKYQELDLDEAFLSSQEWELDEPYSSRPFAFGSSLACHLDKYDLAINNAREGLISNPSDFLLQNNLAFALLNNGNVEDASKIILEIQRLPLDEYETIIYKATSGLLAFKKGDVVSGRNLYLEAMDKGRRINDERLYIIAALNLAIAEIENSTPEAKEISNQALNISKDAHSPDIIFNRKKLEQRMALFFK